MLNIRGKTALAIFINNFVARQGKKTLLHSLEMSGSQIFEREVSCLTGINTKALRNVGKVGLSDQQWNSVYNGIGDIKNLDIYIDDKTDLTLPLLLNKIRNFKEENADLALITIDYLTLLQLPKADRRDLSIGEVTRQLKLLAGELRTPIILLSQLSRESAKAHREPIPADLRDSGSIEQDADKIIFPYRQEVHDPNTPNRGLAKIIKAKVRDGEIGHMVLGFSNGNFIESKAVWANEEPPKSNYQGGFKHGPNYQA